MPLPAPVVPRSEVALIDEAAAMLGVAIADLMERAGRALAHEAMALAPEGPICVLTGPGNNGGDGWACARHLHEAGRAVSVWPVMAPRSALCQRMAGALPAAVPRVERLPPDCTLVVDAILGAGVQGRPREPVVRVLRLLRETRAPILAADVPTGLGTDLVAPARLTLCFQVAKSELLGQPGLGEFKTVDIGIPAAAYKEVQPACLRRFPPLRRAALRGTHGELLVIGGGPGPGALDLACRAAASTGCDLVRAWTTQGPPLPPTVVAHREGDESLATADPEALTPLLVRASAVLIGPGIGRADAAREAAQQAFSLALEVGVPVAIDAEALTALAAPLRALAAGGDHHVLVCAPRTDLRTLLDRAPDEEALHALARPDRVLLARGAEDLVSDGRRWQRNPRGNPRLSAAGMGEVVSGLAAGLMARGAGPFDAARMASLWTATAAEPLWQERGPCWDAVDLHAALPAALRGLMAPLGMWPPAA